MAVKTPAPLAEETLRTLYDVAVAATGMLDVDRLAKLTVDEARRLLRVDCVILRWHDPVAGVLRLLASNDPNAATHHAEIADDAGVMGRAFQENRPVVVDDYQAAAPGLRLSWAADYGWACAMAVPLVVESAPRGGLLAIHYTPRTFSPADVTAMSLLAAQLGPAIEAGRLHARLAISERNFRAVFDTVGAGIAKCDLSGRILDCNPQMLELFGYTYEQILALKPGDLCPPGEGDTSSAYQELLEGRRGGYTIDRRWLRSDGTPFWGRLSISLVRDGTRKPEFFYANLIDISDHIQSEAALRASESQKSAIIESAPDAIIVSDGEGRILEFNSAAERLYGRPRELVVGHSIGDVLVGPEQQGGFRASYLAYRETPPGKLRHRTTAFADRPDGSSVPVEISVTSFEERGELRITALVHDLSDQQRADSALRENEAKSRFMATMSHELRTPLNSILGFGQLLQRSEVGGDLTPKQARYVTNIVTSGHHLLELVNDVLDMSKIVAGELRVESLPIQLAGAIGSCATHLRPDLASKGLELALDIPDDLWVCADELRVRQVVLNLLSNAVKFTERGSIRVAAVAAGAQVEVSVVDTGPGIAPADLERVFTEFIQLEGGPGRHHGGTGLGLPICRRLVELMGGDISLESEVDKGSAFTFRLPRYSGTLPDRAPISKGVPTPS
jgi:PAS domain S-box-containing protein